MITTLLKNKIQFQDYSPSWKQAIETAAQPLLDNGSIEQKYIDSIIDNVIRNGNYIIIIPGVAMPHARPENGSHKDGISFLRLKNPVMFPEENPVSLFFVLSAEHNEAHLELISELAEIFSDEEKIEKLMNSNNESEVLTILSSEGDEIDGK